MTRSGTDTPELSRRRLLGSTLAAAVLVAGGGAVGAGLVRRSDDSAADLAGDPSEVDAGFLSDMSTHHGQALVLCQRVLGQDTGGAVQAAAAEVLQNQAIELGMMRAWLSDWGHSTAGSAEPMAWMALCGMDDMVGGAMPGMASDDELRELSLASGRDRGRRWLELMTAHHEGGVMMASLAATCAQADKVRRLAETQAEVQSYEITMYQQLLATTYAT